MIRLQMHVQIVLIVAIVGICAPESFASCAPPAPFRCSLPASPVAFVGTVISKQDVDLRPAAPAAADNRPRRSARSAGDPVPPRDESYVAVTFRVTEALRGDFDDTIVIRTGPSYSSVRYQFEIDGEYLVFAGPQNGYLYTDSCTGNRAVATEAAFIRELRAARQGSRMADIFGMVSTVEGHVTPVANVTVTATSNVGEYRTVRANRNRCACRRRTAHARHTHQSAPASRESASAGAMPKRSATGAPAATRRLSSVVNTRKRSKRATVKSSRRAMT
jgi:hypothetical protein